ncbi:hypothetical protein NL676_022893 [Syzygium grande]|nr:hypothetical protein NL676_022893 [Syzygium grande]
MCLPKGNRGSCEANEARVGIVGVPDQLYFTPKIKIMLVVTLIGCICSLFLELQYPCSPAAELKLSLSSLVGLTASFSAIP